VTGGCRVTENLCDQNAIGVRGIATSSRIEGNTLTFNSIAGIKLDTGGNTVFRNSAKGSPTNYDVPGNDVGPISSAASATSPFANIQF
jgi:parallel beta-helix repeat protein